MALRLHIKLQPLVARFREEINFTYRSSSRCRHRQTLGGSRDSRATSGRRVIDDVTAGVYRATATATLHDCNVAASSDELNRQLSAWLKPIHKCCCNMQLNWIVQNFTGTLFLLNVARGDYIFSAKSNNLKICIGCSCVLRRSVNLSSIANGVCFVFCLLYTHSVLIPFFNDCLCHGLGLLG